MVCLNEISHAMLRKSGSETKPRNEYAESSAREQNERQFIILSAVEQKEQPRNFSCRMQSMHLTCKTYTHVPYTEHCTKCPGLFD